MNLNLSSSAEEIQKHLKEHYSLRCNFTFVERKSIPKKNSIFPFSINENTRLNEVSDILPFLGFKIDFLNKDGQLIPLHYTFGESKSYKFFIDEEYEFNQLIRSIDAISTTTDYADIEWIKRIIIRAITKANTQPKVELLKEKIELIFSTNDKFMKSDYDEVYQFFNRIL